MSLNILFAGTPEFAALHLQALLDSEHTVIGVYTQPDRPSGRGKKLQPSPVKALALAHQLPVYQPLNFKEQASVDELTALNADVMVVVAYGLILPPSILAAPKYGCLNVHASLLPRWRGAAPIQRSLEAGDKITGITIMQMDQGLDTGDMLTKVHTGIQQDDTGGSLEARLAELGPEALLTTLAQLEPGTLTPEKQNNGLANYAHKLLKDEALLDWSQDADTLALKIRALNPSMMAFTVLGDERIRVLQAQATSASLTRTLPGTIVSVSPAGLEVSCGEGHLLISHIQLAGKKAMSMADVLNGQPHLFQVNHLLASTL